MLVTYLDETGLHPGAKFTIVAGLAAPLSDWVSVQGLWRQRLDQDEISTFHGTDCRGGHNEFHRRDFSTERRKNLWRDLANMIDANRFTPVSGMLLNSAYDRLDEVGFKGRFPSAYSVCLEMCFAQIDELAKLKKTKVTVIVAETQQFRKRSELVAEAYELSVVHSRSIQSIKFASPKEVIPLQVADMLCYETLHNQSKTAKVTEFLTWNLCRGTPRELGWFYDAEALHALVGQHPTSMIA